MQLGLSTYTLTWSIGVPGYPSHADPVDAIELVRITRQAGLGLLQIADNLPLHAFSDQELAHLRDAARENDVQIEVGTRGTDPAHLLDYLRIARRLGAKLCRTLITQPGIHTAREHLQAVLPSFQEAGVVIGIENHGLHTTRQLVDLFTELDNPYVGCCMDTVNSFSALNSPDEVIRDLTPYLVNLHIKDFEITRVDHQMGFVVLGQPAGYGKLNIPELVARIERLQRNPTAILELWTPYTRTIEETVRLEREWLEKSLAYLKSIHGFE